MANLENLPRRLWSVLKARPNQLAKRTVSGDIFGLSRCESVCEWILIYNPSMVDFVCFFIIFRLCFTFFLIFVFVSRFYGSLFCVFSERFQQLLALLARFFNFWILWCFTDCVIDVSVLKRQLNSNSSKSTTKSSLSFLERNSSEVFTVTNPPWTKLELFSTSTVHSLELLDPGGNEL